MNEHQPTTRPRHDIGSLEELIEKLREVFEEDRVNVEEVESILLSYKSKPADWKQFAMFDIHRYTRNLVDTGNGKYNLMALCWGEGHGSSIHDHSNSHCFVKMLDGDLKETLYEWPEDDQEKMTKRKETVFHKDQVAYINDTIGLHRMENPSHTDGAISLHLYVPPFQECRVFDEKTCSKQEVKVTFWSEYGQRTPFTTKCSQPKPCCDEYAPENN